LNFEKNENCVSYFFESGSNQWNLDTPINDLYKEELAALKGLSTSFQRMQEEFLAQEKRRQDECSE
jgi:hypothetical protein